MMENAKKYLQKVLIYADETLIGVYRPTIDKNTCHIKTLENFENVDISNLITNKNTKENVLLKSNTLLKTAKNRRKKKHNITLQDIELTLLKNKIYNEYILFLSQISDSSVKHTVCLELSGKLNKHSEQLKHATLKKINNNIGKCLNKCRKSRKQPRNYKKLVGFEKIFEENIKNKLKSCLKLYDGNIAASAIFQTNNKEELKLFLTQEIKSEKDVNIFIKKLNIMNNSSKKIIHPDLTPKNVQAFIVLNENKKDLYLELTDINRQSLNKPLQNSQIVKYDNKKFINANMLHVKLHNLKIYTSFKKLHKSIKNIVANNQNSEYSLKSSTNSLISINEYSINNIYDMLHKYEDNLTSNFTSTTRSCDNIIKDTYKMLVELQLNAIEQCNQLYLTYFENKNWPKEKQIKFTDTMKNNYGLLLKLQNKAIENSVFVNKKIKNVNKFLNKLSEKTYVRHCCSTSNLCQKVSVTNYKQLSTTSLQKYPRKVTSFSDCKLVNKKVQVLENLDDKNSETDVSECTSTITVIHKPYDTLHEIEVQTSLKDLHEIIEKVTTINKSCSPINIIELQDKKCVQTDISVNKNTCIDFGGQRVQICKRNINLKMRKYSTEPTIKEKLEQEIEKNVEDTKKLQKQILISPSEKEILNQLGSPKVQRIGDNEDNLTTNEEILKKPSKELITENDNLRKLVEIPDEISSNNEENESGNIDGEQNEEEIEESESFVSDMEAKMKKLSMILKKIQEESKPINEDIVFCSSSKKLSTIPEETKEEIKVEPRKNEFLFNIKNTLEKVKERFEKNNLILKKVTDLKDNYMVATNIKKLIETSGMRRGEFPGKPKFIKLPAPDLKSLSSSSTIKSVKQTKLEIAKNLSSSLQLLKNLNEATKNIKSNPNSAMIQLSDIEESIQFQRRLTPKYRCDKSHLTLTPIKNFIASNKMKVSNNATRLSKYEARLKKSRIVPSINSIHIMDLTRLKNKKTRRQKCTKVSSTFIKIPKPAIHPTIQTTHELPLIPKIYRPITPKHYQLDNANLSNLTLSDVAPFQPEYPRKDNLAHIEIEKTYLYKLLNNSFSEKSLEPLIKCSNINCISCTTMSNKRIERNMKKRREFFPKNKNPEEITCKETCIWEKMHWNTEITVQPDHDFDFKQFMDDPNLMKTEIKPQNLTVCPVNVSFDRPSTETAKTMPQTLEQHLKNLQQAVTINKTVANRAVAHQPQGNSKTGTVLQKNMHTANINQNKIQKSIQQAILKNQEKFKFIEQSLTPKNNQNPPKFKKNIPIKTPKIISSGTLNNKKILWQKLSPQFSKRNELFLRRQQNAIATKDDNVFDRKYKENLSLSMCPSSEKTNMDDGILNQISQTVKKSQDDMQKYIELVEQKFLRTFSMPETEKATAYTNLESEIKEMLHLLNTSKDKKRELAALEAKTNKTTTPKSRPTSRPISAKIQKKNSVDKTKIIKSTSEKTRPSSKTSSKSTNKSQPIQQKYKKPELIPQHPKKQEKMLIKPSNCSVIMIKEPNKNNFISGSEVAMDEENKKKAREKPRPTICTDPINFLESFTAIVSKQNFMLPGFKKSASILKPTNHAHLNLNMTSSDKSVNKKVRFQLDDIKITKSDSSVTLSTDEEYSTLYEETASEFSSSDQEFANIISLNMDFTLLLNLKTSFFIEYSFCIPEIYYIISFYEQVIIEIMPENYDEKIICPFAPPVSSFETILEPTEIVYKSDSLSQFIENCEEIIEATKNLELDQKKSSPEILEFLNIITSLSVEHIAMKNELYYQISNLYSFPQHFPLVYYLCSTFHPILYKTSIDFDITYKLENEPNELGTLVPKTATKFVIPFENIDALIKQSAETSKIMPYQNMQLQKHFSEPEFSNELLKYHIKIPFCEELVKSHSDTRCLDVLTYNTRHNYESICQTLVLNLQIQNCGHRKLSLNKNARKTIRKKCYLAPSKNKLQLKAIQVDFGFDKNKLLSIEAAHRRLLISLYFILFSFAFLCITLNYKCQ